MLTQSEYEIDDPLPEWSVVDGEPLCGHCGKSLHLLFDLGTKTAAAECHCIEDLGGNKRRERKRRVITIR